MTTTQCVTAAETQDVRLHVEGNVPSNRGILTGRMRRLETRVTQMQMNECVVPYPCKRLSCDFKVKVLDRKETFEQVPSSLCSCIR